MTDPRCIVIVLAMWALSLSPGEMWRQNLMFFVVWGSNPIQKSTRTLPRNSSTVVLLSDCYDSYDCCLFCFEMGQLNPQSGRGWWNVEVVCAICAMFQSIEWGGWRQNHWQAKIKWVFVGLHGCCSMWSFLRNTMWYTYFFQTRTHQCIILWIRNGAHIITSSWWLSNPVNEGDPRLPSYHRVLAKNEKVRLRHENWSQFSMRTYGVHCCHQNL